MCVLRALLLCICLLLTTLTMASVEVSDEDLLTRRDHTLIDQCVTQFGVARPPLSNGVLLLVRQYGGFIEIVVIGPKGTDSRRIAEVVDKWNLGDGRKGTVRYGDTDETGPVARLRVDNSKLLANAVATTLRPADYVHSLKLFDSRVTPIWLIPNYAKVEGIQGEGQRGEKSTTYDLSGSTPQIVRVATELSPYAGLIALGLGLYVPVLTSLGFAVATWVSRRQSIPLARRRALYPKIVYGFTFGAIGTHIPVFLFLILTPLNGKIGDAWQGSRTGSTIFLPLFLVGTAVMPSVARLMARVEKKLFGLPQGEKASESPSPKPREKLTRELFIKRYGVSLLGVAIYAGSFLLPNNSGVQTTCRLVGISVAFLFLNRGTNTLRELPKRPLAGTRVNDLGNEIAAALGLEPVPIRSHPDSVIGAMVWSKDLIMVTERFETELTESEQRFMLAHEYAHIGQIKGRNRTTRMVVPMVISTVVFIPMFLRLFGVPVPFWTIGFTFVGTVGGMAYMAFGRSRYLRRVEYEADRRAMDYTHDFASAKSALLKMQFSSEAPYLDDSGFQFSHPALWRRIQHLQEMG